MQFDIQTDRVLSFKRFSLICMVVSATQVCFALPIDAVNALHDPMIHGATPLLTNHEFWDDDTPAVVTGQVIALTGDDPITAFTVRTQVTNNTPRDWASYVFSFEYAQHDDRHWDKEGYSPIEEPQSQPVLTPIAPGEFLKSPTVYTVFDVPSLKAKLPDIPGQLRPALKSGATDTFTQTFSLDQAPGTAKAGTFRGEALYEYLKAAKTSGLDIHWARESSRGSSNYPDVLALGFASQDQFQYVTKFDDPNPGSLPAHNSGPPKLRSNVSVFPVMSKQERRRAVAATESPGPQAVFNPLTRQLTFTPGAINELSLIADPADARYAGDVLYGAQIIADPLQLQLGLDGRSYYFGGAGVRIEKDGVVYLTGTLGDSFGFLAADITEQGGFLQNFGMLHDVTFPQGTLTSPFLQDLAQDLTDLDAFPLDFAVRTLNGLPLTAFISAGLDSGTTASTDVQLLIVPNGTARPVPEPGILALNALGAIFLVRRRTANPILGWQTFRLFKGAVPVIR